MPLGVRPVEFNRERPRDAYGAPTYLRSRADVYAERIAVLGQSNGAMAMLSAIADGARPNLLSKTFVQRWPFIQAAHYLSSASRVGRRANHFSS